MAIRSNHYDSAFEEFLRARQNPYVVVDEKRRAVLAEGSIKSFDFIVEGTDFNWLVDVKGRLWGGQRRLAQAEPDRAAKSPRSGPTPFRSPARRRWENWATEDDIASLLRWEQVFGDRYRGLLVFAYAIDASASPPSETDRDQATLFSYRDHQYFFTATSVQDYADRMKPRSAGWSTVDLRAADYTAVRRPFETLLPQSPQAA